jgi:hypothetical protein
VLCHRHSSLGVHVRLYATLEAEENLDALDVVVPADALKRLEDATAISLGFPTDFLADARWSV